MPTHLLLHKVYLGKDLLHPRRRGSHKPLSLADVHSLPRKVAPNFEGVSASGEQEKTSSPEGEIKASRFLGKKSNAGIDCKIDWGGGAGGRDKGRKAGEEREDREERGRGCPASKSF